MAKYEISSGSEDSSDHAQVDIIEQQKPKRPQSGFFMYMNAIKPEIRKAEPRIHYYELMKRIGTMWKELSAREKSVYLDEAGLQLVKY